MTEWFYWDDVLETWVQCTLEEYQSLHYGRSFTRVLETN